MRRLASMCARVRLDVIKLDDLRSLRDQGVVVGVMPRPAGHRGICGWHDDVERAAVVTVPLLPQLTNATGNARSGLLTCSRAPE